MVRFDAVAVPAILPGVHQKSAYCIVFCAHSRTESNIYNIGNDIAGHALIIMIFLAGITV